MSILKRRIISESQPQDSMVLALSLFVILLAFFIVLNAVSSFSPPKVEQAIDSIDTTFTKSFLPNDMAATSANEQAATEDTMGSGDAVETLQGSLRSLLPNLNLEANPDPNGGNIMAVRMDKNQFERLSSDLIPMFVRILNEKDGDAKYALAITSFVRDPLSNSARTSFEIIDQYATRMMDDGLAGERLSLSVEKGNPAVMLFRFYPAEGGV